MAYPYDDSLSAEEEAQLNGHLASGDMPPADSQDGTPAAEAAADTGDAAPSPASAAEAPQADGTQSEGQQPPVPDGGQAPQSDDEKFAAFMAQHKDKSPEDLARLAFQQSQRAANVGYQARQTQQTLEAIQQRVNAAAQRVQQVRDQNANKRQAFSDKLNSDPDAAAQELHERMLTAEEHSAIEAEREARLDAAVTLATSAIPDFQQRAPTFMQFGSEMGYSRDELAGISDGRDLVTLALASYAGNLIKAGLMDTRGNLTMEMPKAIANNDPRLNTPAPVATLSSAPARGGSGGKTVEQMASDVLNMSDADFAKMPAKELDALLRQLEG